MIRHGFRARHRFRLSEPKRFPDTTVETHRHLSRARLCVRIRQFRL